MGRPKIKIIDDSQSEADRPLDEKPKKGRHKDELVEKLKAELGIREKPVKKKVGEGREDALTRSESLSESVARRTSLIREDESVERPKSKQKPNIGKQKPRGKKYQEVAKLVDSQSKYPLNEAIDLVKKVSYSSFDGSLEAHINTNVKSLRGSVSLPFASGKKVRILAFGKGAENSGADIIGNESTLEKIKNGKIDFDFLITTPEWMPKIAPLAKILGPKGLMPNPKNGTITEELKKTVSEFQTGKIQYQTESNGKVMHLSLGKISQSSDELSQNIKVLIQNIGKTKLTKIVLSPTMGPGVKLDLSSI